MVTHRDRTTFLCLLVTLVLFTLKNTYSIEQVTFQYNQKSSHNPQNLNKSEEINEKNWNN